jgi:hypothetical protein
MSRGLIIFILVCFLVSCSPKQSPQEQFTITNTPEATTTKILTTTHPVTPTVTSTQIALTETKSPSLMPTQTAMPQNPVSPMVW